MARTGTSQHVKAIAIVSGAAALAWLLHPQVPHGLGPMLLVAVALCAALGGVGPGLTSAAAAVLMVGVFMATGEEKTPPTLELVSLLSLLVVALAMGFLHAAKTRAQDTLRERNQRLQLLSDQIPGALWSTDADLRLTSGLGAHYELLGGPRGMSLFELFGTHDDSFEPIAAHRRALRGQSCKYELAWRGRTFQCHVEPLRDNEGKIIGVVGVGSDITERQRAEQELRDAQRELEEANHAKDRFLAMLSHELRTPLSPVLALSNALQGRDDLPADVRADIATIRRNAELESRLIDDLLDLTRIARGKLQLEVHAVDVHDLLSNTLEICRHEAQDKGVKIQTEFAATRQFVRGDTARLQQIFWNLLRNAIKFTPAGGSVRILTADHADDRVRIAFADTGIGIDPQLLPRIFDAFEQGGSNVTRQFGGLGLGLAISKGMVTAHGGTISAASDGTGKGATFTVELAAGIQGPGMAAAPEELEGPRLQGLRILLVEDHADTARVMSRLLSASGFVTRTAGTIAQALAVLKAHPIDLLISDIGLPDGSGLDLMKKISAERDIKGIALTGYGNEADLRNCAEAGFSACLVKPVSIGVLRDTIAEVIGALDQPASPEQIHADVPGSASIPGAEWPEEGPAWEDRE